MIRELMATVAIALTPSVVSAATTPDGPSVESVILEAIRQAPAMGVLVLVVYLFLRSMRERDLQLGQALQDVTKVLGDLREDLARKGNQ